MNTDDSVRSQQHRSNRVLMNSLHNYTTIKCKTLAERTLLRVCSDTIDRRTLVEESERVLVGGNFCAITPLKIKGAEVDLLLKFIILTHFQSLCV